jgi:hypothetical protein
MSTFSLTTWFAEVVFQKDLLQQFVLTYRNSCSLKTFTFISPSDAAPYRVENNTKHTKQIKGNKQCLFVSFRIVAMSSDIRKTRKYYLLKMVFQLPIRSKIHVGSANILTIRS